MIIDSDQHLYESRTLWLDHIDPAMRGEALRIEDDAVGTPWLRWRGERVGLVEVQKPGRTAEIGAEHRRGRQGVPPLGGYDAGLPAGYLEPARGPTTLAGAGVCGEGVIPHYRRGW